jgi:hypothetical protein
MPVSSPRPLFVPVRSSRSSALASAAPPAGASVALQPAHARWLAAAALAAVVFITFSSGGDGNVGGSSAQQAQQAQQLLASVRREAPPPRSAAEAEALALLASATSTATPTPTPTPTPTTTTTPSHSPRASSLPPPSLTPEPSASQAPPSPSAPPAPPASPAPPAPPAPRVFWTSDLHDGTRCDTATTLTVGLGQQVILGGHKHTRAAHPSCVNGVRWPRRPYSELIRSHESHNHYISEAEVRANFEYYKEDPDIAEVDAFYCEFPMSFCEAWLPFNKTVIYLAGHRFSLARCSQPQVLRLIEHLLEAEARGHIVASATTYDAAYINYFTGLRPPVVRWSALFYAGWRQFPQPPAAAMRAEILVGPLQRDSVLYGAEIAAASAGRFAFATARQLYGHFELRNLVAHRAAVLFPYVAHNSFGIVELYALGIPIFVPSPEFLLQLGIVDDRLMTTGDYCGPGAWFAPRHAQSLHGPSPESAAPDDSLYWLRLAEFYQLPLITTFSSFADLAAKLEAAGDFVELRGAVARRLEKWEGELLAQWAALVERIPKGRAVPRSYEEALRLVVRASSVQAQ